MLSLKPPTKLFVQHHCHSERKEPLALSGVEREESHYLARDKRPFAEFILSEANGLRVTRKVLSGALSPSYRFLFGHPDRMASWAQVL